ncbi:ureidoglycolate hydrolase [Obelidium mucronatum]|nr:ureidoglycolate hydrolase [Obelidium mucronatum]
MPPRVIKLEPLSSKTFNDFGSVIEVPSSADATTMKSTTANQSTATKYSPISVLAQTYTTPNAPRLSLFDCSPRKLSGGLFPLHIMERHPFTTQTFLPLGLSSANDPDTAYLVIVAPPKKGAGITEETPDMSRVRAFLANGGQGVTYGVGVWHSPMVVVGKNRVQFAVLQWVNGVSRDECTECEIVSSEADESDGLVVEVPSAFGLYSRL